MLERVALAWVRGVATPIDINEKPNLKILGHSNRFVVCGFWVGAQISNSKEKATRTISSELFRSGSGMWMVVDGRWVRVASESGGVKKTGDDSWY